MITDAELIIGGAHAAARGRVRHASSFRLGEIGRFPPVHFTGSVAIIPDFIIMTFPTDRIEDVPKGEVQTLANYWPGPCEEVHPIVSVVP